MNKFLRAPVLFFFSSSIVILIFYFRFTTQILFEFVAVLLVIVLLMSGYILRSTKPGIFQSYSKEILLFLASLFIQMLILATGGLYSPFLILIHISTLGISLFTSSISALLFLFFSLVAIVFHIIMYPEVQKAVIDDPGAVLLYLAVFVVVVPLSINLSTYYHIKDSILKLLKQEIMLRESRQKAVLNELNELVVVTDKNLIIISINEAVEKTLALSFATILHNSFFTFFLFRDNQGVLIDASYPQVKKCIDEKIPQTIRDLQFFTRNSSFPVLKASIHLRPFIVSNGTLDQISMVIATSQALGSSTKTHIEIEKARVSYAAKLEKFKGELISNGLLQFRDEVELLKDSEEDMLSMIELSDAMIQLQQVPVDVARLCKQTILSEKEIAKALNVSLAYKLLNFGQEDITHLIPQGYMVAAEELTGPFFTVYVDITWFDLLIRKLLDIAIFLSKKDGTVRLSIERKPENTATIVIHIVTEYIDELSLQDQDMLFTKYYGTLLHATNLNKGSGLEGYIAKSAADILHLPLTVRTDAATHTLVFSLEIKKGSVTNE